MGFCSFIFYLASTAHCNDEILQGQTKNRAEVKNCPIFVQISRYFRAMWKNCLKIRQFPILQMDIHILFFHRPMTFAANTNRSFVKQNYLYGYSVSHTTEVTSFRSFPFSHTASERFHEEMYRNQSIFS